MFTSGTEAVPAGRPQEAEGDWRTSPSQLLSAPDRAALTDRQRQVAHLVAAGCSNDQIGMHLGISSRTAKAHVDVLRFKLGVTHRRQIPLAYYLATGEALLSSFHRDGQVIPLPRRGD